LLPIATIDAIKSTHKKTGETEVSPVGLLLGFWFDEAAMNRRTRLTSNLSS